MMKGLREERKEKIKSTKKGRILGRKVGMIEMEREIGGWRINSKPENGKIRIRDRQRNCV